VTIDNQPIYDHSVGDGIVVKDKRMAIDMLIVRRDIRRKKHIILKWVDSKHMLVDCLTKLDAPVALMIHVSRNGVYDVVLRSSEKEVGEIPASKQVSETLVDYVWTSKRGV